MLRNYSSLVYEEKLDLLNKELEKVQHEINISELIYSLHECDTYEDLFRDNIPMLKDKMNGIIEAIKNLETYNSDVGNLHSGVSDFSTDSD
jgi:hypothetical protein